MAGHPNDRSLTMVDLFCCTGAITGQVPAVGSEVLSRVIVSGREVLTRERLRADSGFDPLSARVVAALADSLSSGVQLPTAGYGPVRKHLTIGITHPEKVNSSGDGNSTSRAFGTVRRCSWLLYDASLQLIFEYLNQPINDGCTNRNRRCSSNYRGGSHPTTNSGTNRCHT